MKPASNQRVVASHAIARRAFRAAAFFAVAAAVWAAFVLWRGGSWWGPLHAFLAGTVLLAISGASQMFTITWAAASPPSARLTTSQRWLVIVGVASVLVGVTGSLPVVVWFGAGAIVGGLTALALSIVGAVKRSLLRRFDLSARFYLTAFACGGIGMILGALLGSGAAGEQFARWRLVHSHLNLVGLVGFTIIGTIPTFMATVVHHRSVSGREAIAAWWLCLASGLSFVAGLVGPGWLVGAGAILAAAAAATMLAGIIARLWEKGHQDLQFLQVGIGVAWLIVWCVVDGLTLVSGSGSVPFNRWTTAAVLAGVGQVLAGSLAYLVPVLTGPPLSHKFETMTRRGWIPLVAANLGGALLVAGLPTAAVILFLFWFVDFGRRLSSLALNRSVGRNRRE
jgi:nitrite reductase (NO-forming)